VQADILDRCPDNRQATGLRCEHVNLVGALPHIAEQAFDGIGGLNVAMHRLRELVKRQEMLFVLCQASYRFWIALSVLGFEGRQLGQRLLLIGLLPDAHEFSLDFPTLASGNGIEHIALFMRPSSVDVAWPQTTPRPPKASRRAHRSRSGRCEWPLVSADLAAG
jgi:hypothetical protein